MHQHPIQRPKSPMRRTTGRPAPAPIYADEFIERAREGNVLPLLLHYLCDNPNPASLRASARLHARHALDPAMPREARIRSAVKASAQLLVASALDPRTDRLP